MCAKNFIWIRKPVLEMWRLLKQDLRQHNSWDCRETSIIAEICNFVRTHWTTLCQTLTSRT